MYISELAVLRWIHILSMVYWLGGEWGIFQTARHIINRKLPMEERKRHMETAYRIDILARTGIILLLPLGLHLGHFWNTQPYGGHFLVWVWIATGAWLLLCWAAFVYRETDRGIRLTKIDEAIRFIVIPVLALSAIASLLGHGPFNADDGQRWYSVKALIFSGLLILGLKLRFIMREWTVMFRRIAAETNTAGMEARLEHSLKVGDRIAYAYWIGIALMGFLGATKPF